MKDERRLSVFQEEREAALTAALGTIGAGLSGRRLEGIKETLIRSHLRGTDAEAFIYNDGAGLLGSNVDKRFEAPDYENGDALARAFIDQTVEYARRHARHS